MPKEEVYHVSSPALAEHVGVGDQAGPSSTKKEGGSKFMQFFYEWDEVKNDGEKDDSDS